MSAVCKPGLLNQVSLALQVDQRFSAGAVSGTPYLAKSRLRASPRISVMLQPRLAWTRRKDDFTSGGK